MLLCGACCRGKCSETPLTPVAQELRTAGRSVRASEPRPRPPRGSRRRRGCGRCWSGRSACRQEREERRSCRRRARPGWRYRRVRSALRCLVRPRARSSRKRGDDEQAVVDADRQAHHRDHVGDEEGELVRLTADTATSAIATKIAEQASTIGRPAATSAPKTRTRMIKAIGMRSEFCAREVFFGLGVEVVVYGAEAGDVDL